MSFPGKELWPVPQSLGAAAFLLSKPYPGLLRLGSEQEWDMEGHRRDS